MAKLMRVIDIWDYRRSQGDYPFKETEALWEASHEESIEGWGNSNDSYYPWDVCATEEEFHSLTDEQARLIDEMCIAEGAKAGETVLIKHWW